MKLHRLCLYVIPVVFVLFMSHTAHAQDDEDLAVLTRWFEWSAPETMLMRRLNRENLALLDRREIAVASMHSRDDWLRRRATVRETLDRIVGPFPERTPLNPQVTGVIQKDGFHVEKIIYESMPGFYVTGALFVPDGITGKRPGILKVIGHSATSFRRETYQNVILNLVMKGFVVFAIDPLGQGERLQYFNPATGKSDVGGSTAEHSYVANQCLLSGMSSARYFTWDGMRGIDYLVSRPEVDPDRIGVTGLSGGGTQTAYIAAMDDRVTAAAPTCYIVGFRRLLATLGPQDGEQNFYHGLANGIDHADLLLARAPRPTLMVTTTRDFFSIQGARETATELHRAYAAFGAPGAFGMVEDDYGHGFTTKNNEATFAFFQRHLNLPGDPTELDIPFLTEEELQVTTTGQVSTALGGETVFSLNRAATEPLLEQLENARQRPDTHLPHVLQQARELSGYRKILDQPAVPVFRGRYSRDGYTIEKYVLASEDGMILPLLLFLPGTGGPHPAVIYAHPDGKQADAAPGGRIEELVRRGIVVAAPDLPGIGETWGGDADANRPERMFYAAQLGGRSIAGIHAGDLARTAAFLQTRAEVEPEHIGIVGIGDLGPAALLATAMEPSLRSLTLVNATVSYASIVMNEFYDVHPKAFIAGALTAFDLPDLIAAIAPRKVALAGATDERKRPISAQRLQEAMRFPVSVFAARSLPDHLRIEPSGGNPVDVITWMLQ